MQLNQDTIAAISTPAGRGGIGIVRLSGSLARACAASMLQIREPLVHAQARFTHLLDADGKVLDEAIVTWFEAPRSYTAEDVVEIATHGAPVLLEYVLRIAALGGARLAEPGEFTQRAFLSGRLDLTQAEAVHDLISANTLQQARLAAAQLGGSIARIIAPIKQSLLNLIAVLEAGVDFAEDDLDLLKDREIEARIALTLLPLEDLLRSYAYGRVLREGVRLAIVGLPNAGKSSLFNRLLESDRAIVTAHAGTTRDPIAERLVLAGLEVELVDTAGLRHVDDSPEHEAEREGIARSRNVMAEADLILHVVDANTVIDSQLVEGDHAMQVTLGGRPSILVLNKVDLKTRSLEIVTVVETDTLCVSARTGENISLLKELIVKRVAGQPSSDSATITNMRQCQAIQSGVDALKKAAEAATQKLPHEFVLLDLHDALSALDLLTGASTPDDILQLIFSTFCIGK